VKNGAYLTIGAEIRAGFETLMKKAILFILAMAGYSILGLGQGVITFDDSEAPGPTVITNAPPPNYGDLAPDTASDINAVLLYSIEFGQPIYEPLVTLLLSDTNATYGILPAGTVEPAAGDITIDGNGTLFDATGNKYQLNFPAGTVVTFAVAGWFGNYSSLSDAQSHGTLWAITAPFQETLSSATDLMSANISNMPELPMLYIPEPATVVLLAAIGSGVLFTFRRK
jgi:hypothetical protein